MRKITEFIIKARSGIIILFIVLAICGANLSKNVKINYDMTKYLPKSSETRNGMDIMDMEFAEKTSTINIMFKNLTNKEEMYEKLKNIDGVDSVTYKDNSDYNKKEYTLYVINIKDSADSKKADDVYQSIKKEAQNNEFYLSGNIANRHKTILPLWLIILSVSICTIILIIMCESYAEPFLFLACIGIAVLLNNGTNIIFKSVSNITNSIAAILQLALSMDYSIMLMNRYRQEKEKTKNSIKAMEEALYKSFAAISSSSATTIVGLVSLIFMSFTIGRDLGLVLAKGVLLSLLVIFTCLPALILMFEKIINKTKKKSLNIKLDNLAHFIYKFKLAGFIILIIMFTVGYLLKSSLNISYTATDEDKVADVFKENNQIAIIYNNKYEKQIANYLEGMEKNNKITNVLGYSNTINQKLKYNEFNQKLHELDTDGIDEYLLKIIYYKYYNKNYPSITLDEFVKFFKNSILTNSTFEKHINSEIKNNIDRLTYFTDKNEISKKRTSKDIAKILEIDEKNAYNLFVYYFANKNNSRLTISEFINFINNNVLNSEYKKYISNQDDLKLLNNFTKQENITNYIIASDMALLFNMDKNLVNSLYTYYYSIYGVDEKITIHNFATFVLENILKNSEYQSLFNQDTINTLNFVKTVSDINFINSNLNTKTLATTFNIDENLVKQLLLLKYTKIDNQKELSILNYINFLNYLKDNTNYLDNVDLTDINKLSLFVKNENNINTTKLDSENLANIFGSDMVLAINANNITPYEFVNIVLTKPFSEDVLNKFSLIKFLIEDSLNKKTYSQTMMSSIFNVDITLNHQIYGLYDYINNETENWYETPYNFVSLLIKNTSDTDTKNELEMLFMIMNSEKNNLVYSYNELSSLIKMDEDLIKKIYALYSTNNLKLSARKLVTFMLNSNLSFDESTLNKLKIVDKIMDGVLNETSYTAKEVANILNLNEYDIKLLYALHDEKENISLNEFITFLLNDVLKNEKLKNSFTNESVTKLNTIMEVIEAANKSIKYDADTFYRIMSKLTTNLDKNQVELMYIYYGSENNQEEYELTIEELINYVNDDIIPNPLFEDFIDWTMKNKITDSKKIINDSKKQLIGKNYSRVVINTKFELESNETTDFIKSIYDNLKETETYVIGDSPMAYEMNKTFKKEFDNISILTMIMIFIVVAITFKSIITPLILVLIIECAVYVTMATLSIFGNSVYFIALLIVQSILMGATIDYAIVYTSYYIESRAKLNTKNAVKNAYNKSIHTILTSSSILILATFLIGQFSSGVITSMICKTLALGVLCATILIITILPATISFFDKYITK